MSTVVMAKCWPLQMPPKAKAVLISLADNANDHGECWPSVSKITERCCLSRSSVIRAIGWLEKSKLLVTSKKVGQRSNYTLCPDLFEATEPVSGWNRCHGDTGVRVTPPRCQGDTGTGVRVTPVKATVIKQPSRTSKTILPEWLEPELWQLWSKYRKASKSGFSEAAQIFSLRTLTRLRSEGHQPRTLIETAIERGWSGLYAPKAEARSAASPASMREL